MHLYMLGRYDNDASARYIKCKMPKVLTCVHARALDAHLGGHDRTASRRIVLSTSLGKGCFSFESSASACYEVGHANIYI